jgi:hypothetical protein
MSSAEKAMKSCWKLYLDSRIEEGNKHYSVSEALEFFNERALKAGRKAIETFIYTMIRSLGEV